MAKKKKTRKARGIIHIRVDMCKRGAMFNEVQLVSASGKPLLCADYCSRTYAKRRGRAIAKALRLPLVERIKAHGC